MTEVQEKELVEQIERDVADRGGLIALVVCLCVAGGLLLAGLMSYIPS